MMYWKYLKKLLRHKWFVFLEARKLGISWLGIIHDLSKFLPSEFVSYTKKFYGKENKELFMVAWNHHQKRNKHHWEYWLVTSWWTNPQTSCLPMPDKYRREMLADWIGAGITYGEPDTLKWYMMTKDNIILHPDTRGWIEGWLGYRDYDGNFLDERK